MSEEATLRTSQVTCLYCHSAAKLVDGRAIYPHRPDLSSKLFWQCKPCGAYVGCHAAGVGQGDGTKPLGRLANAALRKAKKDAHYVFDRLWMNAPQRGRARRASYAWLADAMGLTIDECHIGELPKGQRTVENAVRVLAADPRVSCFERGTAWLESLIRDVLRQGLAVEDHAEPYPWCRFNLTDAGRQMLAAHDIK